MEDFQNLNIITDAFLSKGFDGYFLSYRETAGKFKEIVEDYLEKYKDSQAPVPDLHLETYLLWNGEDKPYVSCDLWLSMQDNELAIKK